MPKRRQVTLTTMIHPADGHGPVWVSRPLGDDHPHDWNVRYRIVQQDGNLVVAEISVTPNGQFDDPDWVPPGGLTHRELRHFRITEALDSAHRVVTRHTPRFQVPGFSAEALSDARWRVRTDRLLAEVAAVYVAVVDSGARAPVPEVT